MADTEIKVGEMMTVEMKSGRSMDLPVVDTWGDRIILDDGTTRIQINRRSGVILVLKGDLS